MVSDHKVSDHEVSDHEVSDHEVSDHEVSDHEDQLVVVVALELSEAECTELAISAHDG